MSIPWIRNVPCFCIFKTSITKNQIRIHTLHKIDKIAFPSNKLFCANGEQYGIKNFPHVILSAMCKIHSQPFVATGFFYRQPRYP